MTERQKQEIQEAKEDLKRRSFVIELDREIPKGNVIYVVKDLGEKNGRHVYKVAFYDNKWNWY